MRSSPFISLALGLTTLLAGCDGPPSSTASTDAAADAPQADLGAAAPDRDGGAPRDGASSDEASRDGASLDGALPDASAPDEGGQDGASPDARVRDGSDGGACVVLDVLVVLDDSASMMEERAALAAAFPSLVERLEDPRFGTLDYRIGVTTTGFGQSFPGLSIPQRDGALVPISGQPHPWVARGDGQEAEKLSAAVASIVAQGSAVEQPLRAASEALTARVSDGQNAGFHRADAHLALLVLTDEDDGSSLEASLSAPAAPATLIPVRELHDGLDHTLGGASAWSVGVIAGDDSAACWGPPRAPPLLRDSTSSWSCRARTVLAPPSAPIHSRRR